MLRITKESTFEELARSKSEYSKFGLGAYVRRMTKAFPILVVEDDDNDFLLLERAIRRNGIQNPIHWVKDGVQAIEYLQGHGEFSDRRKHPIPKVVISDLKMPRLGGFELLDWIKNHGELHLLPVLVMTSSHLPLDVSRAYELGATSFFVKPTSFEDLKQLTKTIYEYWIQCVEPDLPRLAVSSRKEPALAAR